MTKEFKYTPPFMFFILGVLGITVSFNLLKAIVIGEGGFVVLIGLLCAGSLILGLTFFVLYIQHAGSGDLKLSEGHIEIPGRWKKRTSIDFNEITSIKINGSWNPAIKIYSNNTSYLIERKWMTTNDFEVVKEILLKKIRQPETAENKL